MRHRLFKQLLGWCFTGFLAFLTLGLFAPDARAADGIEIPHAQLEVAEEGYKLSAGFAFDLNHGLEDAIMRGVPLYFTSEVEIKRPRWYWFDEKTISSAQTMHISYNVLTRQFHVAVLGSVRQSFSTLEDALFLIHRPSRWLVAGKGALKPGEVYNVSVRMSLNLEYLPKPFQVNAINNSDWRLSSNKKYFTYKAEEK